MKEIFKDITSYEGLYQISNFGNVKSLERKEFASYRDRLVKERILKPGLDSRGYLIVVLCKEGRKTHRIHILEAIAFLNHTVCGYNVVVDHIDFNRTNNHLTNLRLISNRENTNQTHINSSSKYTGVCWNKSAKKWRSRIRINKKQIHLGYFTDELKAYEAYKKAVSTL